MAEDPLGPTEMAAHQSQAQAKLLKHALFALAGLLLLATAAFTGYWYGTESTKLPPEANQPLADKTKSQETPTPKPTPFPLNDSAATYRINKINNQRFTLSYIKEGRRQDVYIGKSLVDLTPYAGKDVLVEGEFGVEFEIVQCFRAPCPPVKITVLNIHSVRLK